MASLAVDQDGNMALGYSVSTASQSRHPVHRPAGERPAEYAAHGEARCQTALAPQTNNCGGTCERWGDYWAMTVDPGWLHVLVHQ